MIPIEYYFIILKHDVCLTLLDGADSYGVLMMALFMNYLFRGNAIVHQPHAKYNLYKLNQKNQYQVILTKLCKNNIVFHITNVLCFPKSFSTPISSTTRRR